VSEHETEQDEVQQDDSDDAGRQGDDDRQGDTPGHEDDAPEHGSGGGAV
jgi:hypothetical protein